MRCLQGSQHFGIVFPPISRRAADIPLPRPRSIPRRYRQRAGSSTTASPSTAAAATAAAATTEPAAAADPSLDAELEGLGTSPEAGVFGCCVGIEQHTIIAGDGGPHGGPLGGPHGGPQASCIVECICRNRFRLVDIFGHGDAEEERQLQQQQQQQQQLQQRQQQQQQLAQEDEVPLEARIAAAIMAPEFKVGICFPVVDDPLLAAAPQAAGATPEAAAAVTTATATPETAAATPGAVGGGGAAAAAGGTASAPVQQQEVLLRHRDVHADQQLFASAIDEDSDLVAEFEAVQQLLGDQQRGAPSAAMRLMLYRRVCEICIQGLTRSDALQALPCCSCSCSCSCCCC